MATLEEILTYDDTSFVDEIKRNTNYLNDERIVKRLLNLEVPRIVQYFRNATKEEMMIILNNETEIMNLSDNIFRIMFSTTNDNIKEYMINNDDYLKRMLMVKPNTINVIPFDTINSNLQAKVLNRKEILDVVDLNLYIDLLERLKPVNFDEVISQLDPTNFIKDETELFQVLSDRYNLNEETEAMQQFIMGNFKRDKSLVHYLLKIHNFEELFLFIKYNTLLKLEVNYNEKENDYKVELECGNTLSFKYLQALNRKHVNLLINQLKNNNPNTYDSVIFVTAIKLYTIFGYDNAKKILDNKFTYITNGAIERTALVLHTDNRRKYRLDHQDRFYSNEMVRKALTAVEDYDIEYFEYVLGIHKENAPQLMNDIRNHLDKEKCYEFTTIYLQNAIEKRESDYQKRFIERYMIAYKLQNPEVRKPISCEELYKIFGKIDISNVSINDTGMPIINDSLVQFLLGNLKSDNDSLLRLVFNRCAYGMNETLESVINNFEAIKNVADTSNDKLSIHSILDVIDISKVFLYNMAPNEQDLTLESIAKILRVDKYCSEPKEEIFLRARELHLERKNKIYSSIPIVAKMEKDGVICKTYKYDDPSLIVTGIDTDSCLKVGGKGEDFLRYCMTGSHSLIVKMQDEKNNVYICPFIRNGNGIYGNGIDPAPKDQETSDKLMSSLANYASKFIEYSSKKEPIEFVAITDLHQEKFLKDKKLKEVSINDNIFINADCYADYLKPEYKSYIIAEVDHEYEPKLYVPETKYYEVRRRNYIYHADKEQDNNFINITLNSINYNAIDYKTGLTEKEKNSLKRSYKNLKATDFKYIMGNKDWFVAIDNNLNIIGNLLPFDERARGEYINALGTLESEYVLCKEGSRTK